MKAWWRIQALRLSGPTERGKPDKVDPKRCLERATSLLREAASMHPLTLTLLFSFPGSAHKQTELFLGVDLEDDREEPECFLRYLEHFFPGAVFATRPESGDFPNKLTKALRHTGQFVLRRDADLLLNPGKPPPTLPLMESCERLVKLKQRMVLSVRLRTLGPSEETAVLLTLYGVGTLQALDGLGPAGGQLARLDPDAPAERGPDTFFRRFERALLSYEIRVHSDTPLTNRVACILREAFVEDGDLVTDEGARKLPLHASNGAALFQVPLVDRQCTHLPVQDIPELPPSHAVPRSGISLGRAEFMRESRAVCVSQEDLARHVYVVGKTGAGKTTMLESMIVSAVERNSSAVFVLDPHGDLARGLLEKIPAAHAKRVVYVDCGNTESFFGLNILEASTDAEREFAIGELDQMFLQLYGSEIWGPRLQDLFRNLAALLSHEPSGPGTLLDLVWAIDLHDDNIRARFDKTVASMNGGGVTLKLFLEQISRCRSGSGSLQEAAAYYRAKFSPFVDNLFLRNTLGQQRSTIDFKALARRHAVCIVNLNKGVVSTRYATLLGRILATKLFQTAISHAVLPASERPSMVMFLDEFQNFVSPSIESVLSEARKFNLSVVLANQFLSQVSSSVEHEGGSRMLHAILGNVGSLVCFRVGRTDAQRMSDELGGVVSPEQLAALPNWRAVCSLSTKGAVLPPFICETTPVKGADSASAASIVSRSVREVCRPRCAVEKEIYRRIMDARGLVEVPASPFARLLKS